MAYALLSCRHAPARIPDKENNLFLDNFSKKDREFLISLEDKDENSSDDMDAANKVLKNAKIKSLSDVIKEKSFTKDSELNDWLFDNSYRIFKTAGSSSLAKLIKSFDTTPNQDIAAAVSNKGVLFFYITDFNRDTKQPRLQVIFADSNVYKNPCDFWQDIKTTGAISTEGGVNYNNGKKPLKLLNRIVKMTTTNDDLILDFFSGSASTAHSVLQMNAEEDGLRKFIMIQLPEDLDLSLKKADGNTKDTILETISFLDSINKPHILSELGKERIRRSGKKIKEENKDKVGIENLDTGFRVFRLADSNFEEVKKAPAEYDQSQLDLFLNNVKSDRTDLDLLYGAMLGWGVQLSLPMISEEVDGKMIYSVNDGDLVACFADDITENIVKAMADKQPLRVLFRDSCFGRDDAKINVFETLKQLLDWSEEEAIKNIKVI